MIVWTMVVMVVVGASAGMAEIPLGSMGDRLRPTEKLGKDGDLFPPSVRPSVRHGYHRWELRRPAAT